MASLLFFPLAVVATKSLKERETKWRRILSPSSVSFQQVTPKCRAALTVCFFSSGDGSPPRRETDPPGIISEIFCAVLSALIPLDVSFFFLLARRCGLCYASAKPNRPRNGGVCQNTQRKMFWKGTSHKVGTRSYGKTWSGGPPRCRESPLSAWETGQKELPAHALAFKLSFAFCRGRRRRNVGLSLTEQRAASSPPTARLHFIHSLSRRRCRDLLLAPPFVVRGPFCQAEQTRAEPITCNGSVFSDNPLGERSAAPLPSHRPIWAAACVALTLVVTDVVKRLWVGSPQRAFQPVGTFCSHDIPTGMLDVGTKTAPLKKIPNWVWLEFLTPDNLAPQMETFSETHLSTLCLFPSY